MKNFKFKIPNFKSGAGFTLVEIMVSLSIFVVVMTLIMGSILSVLNNNQSAQAKKTAMDNLDFALESMARTVRFGVNYHCGSAGTLSSPNDCASGASSLTILASDGSQVTYTLSGGVLTRSVNSGAAYAMTSPEIVINRLAFRVFGSAAYGTDYLQPQVIITVSGTAGSANKAATQSTFNLETTVDQRKLDI